MPELCNKATAVVTEFAVEPAQCIPDIAAFLNKLVALGLVQAHSNGGQPLFILED